MQSNELYTRESHPYTEGLYDCTDFPPKPKHLTTDPQTAHSVLDGSVGSSRPDWLRTRLSPLDALRPILPPHLLALASHIYTRPEGVNLPTLLRLLVRWLPEPSDSPRATDSNYHRIRRWTEQLRSLSVISITKQDDGLLWCRPDLPVIDLIKASAKFQHALPSPRSPYSIPLRSHALRRHAVIDYMHMTGPTDFDPDPLNQCFQGYLTDTSQRILLFQAIYPSHHDDHDILGLDYATRFNDLRRRLRVLNHYETALATATDHYKVGVHLTLTTDPKRHQSLWHAARHFGLALNKFFQFVQSRTYRQHPTYHRVKHEVKAGLISKQAGRATLNRLRRECKPVYLSVYEFTHSGLLHAHILIFGRGYLLPKDDITQEWERCNQGTINHIYTIVNTRKGWVWPKDRPRDASKNEDAGHYLAKYLKKNIFQPQANTLYWVVNKRFYSNSRILIPTTPPDDPHDPRYIFLGSFPIGELPVDDLRMIYERLHDHNEVVPPPPTSTIVP